MQWDAACRTAGGQWFSDVPGFVWEQTRVYLHEPLYPQETAFLARAVSKRRDEFITARACARLALRQMGHNRPVMVPGERGAPAWPKGVVGSITHTEGYVAAAVAPRRDVLSLGIDAEQNAPLPDEVIGLVSSAPERERLAGLATARPCVAWDRLLFSAKESIYKAWHPVVGTWLGFLDVNLQFEPDGTFRVELVDARQGSEAASLLRRIDGRWCAYPDLVLTSALIQTGAARGE